ncbi:hypothetical protein FV226_24335 [Methylobacterium sp. WL12]|uniref:hypothetical protein n=1 Tax=Methylobacterium sp. WL12 TaxID=2603890 RepID=UPI0011C8DDC3|nr:hypothetical protein [Methylobacterium sp. WL12]TXM65877.1 hypothetical protein FV226_24335 [Methylobacterium sp. WL12]
MSDADLPPIGANTSSTTATLHRDAIADAAYRASIYAAHAVEYAQLGDDRGLNRSLRLLAICASHAANGLPGLAEAVETDRLWRDSMRRAAPPKRTLTEHAQAERADSATGGGEGRP